MTEERGIVQRFLDWVFDGRPSDMAAVHASALLSKTNAEAAGSSADQLFESGQRISRMANDLRRYRAARKQ